MPLLVVLVACHVTPEPAEGLPEQADTGADSKRDSWSSTDTAAPPEPESDCGDGVDNDADGLLDCEDEDCVDLCIEDCGNGLDDDQDGYWDCDDDECVGADRCIYRDFEITLDVRLWTADVALGPGVPDYRGVDYLATASANGVVQVTGESLEDELSFSCTNDFFVGSRGHGLTYTSADDCPDCDAVFEARIEPDTIWSGNCPAGLTLPVARWGFVQGGHALLSDLGEGSWVEQYPSSSSRVDWVSYERVTYGYFYSFSPSTHIRTMLGSYRPRDI